MSFRGGGRGARGGSRGFRGGGRGRGRGGGGSYYDSGPPERVVGNFSIIRMK